MKCKRLFAAFAVLIFAGTMAADNQSGEKTGTLLEKQFSKDKFSYNYFLYLPDGYGKDAKERWPLMLFLHGGGEGGKELKDLEKVKKHGPPKIAEAKKFPFIVVAPQSPGKGWQVDGLNALLDDVLAKFKCDEDRVYLTGLSMGGSGTWNLATTRPDRFAAIVPICGGGNDKEAAKLKDLPTWVFHGTKDSTVPLKRSEDMVKAIQDAGGKNIKLTIYPDAGHDSWTVTYNNPELYTWLLAQKRVGKK